MGVSLDEDSLGSAQPVLTQADAKAISLDKMGGDCLPRLPVIGAIEVCARDEADGDDGKTGGQVRHEC